MPGGQCPQLLLDGGQAGVAADAVEACHHPFDVAVEDGEGLVPRLAEDGACGAAADAGQGQQRIEIARQVAVMQFHALARGGMQVAGAGVVTQTCPVRHQCVVVGGSQVGQGGEGLDEAQEVRNHRRHLGLLQHDLRQPYPVRRTRMLPRQVVAAVLIEPGKQLVGEGGHGWRHAGGWFLLLFSGWAGEGSPKPRNAWDSPHPNPSPACGRGALIRCCPRPAGAGRRQRLRRRIRAGLPGARRCRQSGSGCRTRGPARTPRHPWRCRPAWSPPGR